VSTAAAGTVDKQQVQSLGEEVCCTLARGSERALPRERHAADLRTARADTARRTSRCRRSAGADGAVRAPACWRGAVASASSSRAACADGALYGRTASAAAGALCSNPSVPHRYLDGHNKHGMHRGRAVGALRADEGGTGDVGGASRLRAVGAAPRVRMRVEFGHVSCVRWPGTGTTTQHMPRRLVSGRRVTRGSFLVWFEPFAIVARGSAVRAALGLRRGTCTLAVGQLARRASRIVVSRSHFHTSLSWCRSAGGAARRGRARGPRAPARASARAF